MFIALSLSGAGILFASPSAAPPNSQPSKTDRTVAQIAQERFDLAGKGYETALERHKKGITTNVQVIKWLRRRADAARDLPDATIRNAALRDYSERLSENVVEEEQRWKRGIADYNEVLVAKDQKLEAELWLARSEMK